MRRRARRVPEAATGRDAVPRRVRNALADEAGMAVRYLHYALSSHSRGENGPARVFAALAVSELIHALRLSRAAGGSPRRSVQVGSAVRHERRELDEVYAPTQRGDLDRHSPGVQEAFRWALEGCRRHLELLAALDDPDAAPPRPLAVCGGCGDVRTTRGDASAICRICGAPAARGIDVSGWADLLARLRTPHPGRPP